MMKTTIADMPGFEEWVMKLWEIADSAYDKPLAGVLSEVKHALADAPVEYDEKTGTATIRPSRPPHPSP